jgi:hypothetical protein
MTLTVKEPVTRAVPSTGNALPMKRHIVDRGDAPKGIPSAALVEFLASEGVKVDVAGATEPQALTLCGEPWDAIGIAPAGAVCDGCAAEYHRRHPGWPLPGGA